MSKLFYLPFFFLFSLPALAQVSADSAALSGAPVPELITDRPDQTESPAIVPKASLQLEAGPSVFVDKGEVQEWSYTSVLLRLGVLEWLELRLAGAYEGFYAKGAEGNLQKREGLAPLILGTKVAVLQEQGFLPATALMYHIALPNTGSSPFLIQRPSHELRANFSHTLTESLGLGYNLGIAWEDPDEIQGLYTLSFARSLTNRLGVFAEVYGSWLKEAEDEHALDGGATFLLRPNLQLDAYLGRALTSSAHDWMYGAGFSWRIPK